MYYLTSADIDRHMRAITASVSIADDISCPDITSVNFLPVILERIRKVRQTVYSDITIAIDYQTGTVDTAGGLSVKYIRHTEHGLSYSNNTVTVDT